MFELGADSDKLHTKLVTDLEKIKNLSVRNWKRNKEKLAEEV